MIRSYFSHDSNARNSEELIAVRMKYGAEGYGIYFMIIERLREETDYMGIKDYNIIAFDLRVSSDKVKSIIEDFGLFVFTECGEYFYSESLNRRMNIKDNKAKQRSEAGKKGAEIRWGKLEKMAENSKNKENDSNAIAKPLEKIAKKSKGKESKGSKEKENNKKKKDSLFKPPSLSEVTDFINENNYNVNPETFIAHYESVGWKVGKNKMKDWRASVRGWHSRNQPAKKEKKEEFKYEFV